MKRTLSAVVIALISGVYIGLAYAFGPIGALIALGELFGFASMGVGLVLVLGLCLVLMSNWRSEEMSDAEAARNAYANGEIPLSEMERRLDVALDPEAQRLRTLVEDVKGVGPETSATIAAEYMTVDALENASSAELEKLYGIGPNTAHAIHQRFNYDPPSAQTTETAETESDIEPNRG